MIVKPPHLSWVRLIFAWQGSVLPKIWKRLFVTTSLAVAVTLLASFIKYDLHMTLTLTPFSLVGLALSIFLGFRNNTSYDRFWEGRKLWGQLVNTSRSMARQCLTLIGPLRGSPDAEEGATLEGFRRDMVYHVIAYVHALRLHLRGQKDWEILAPWLSDQEVANLPAQSNPPIAILHVLAERLREAYDRGWIHPQHLPVLEHSLTVFTDVQGGCERIRSTPIPFSYTVLIHRIVATYCLALPFGIIDITGALTPIVVLLVSYAFFGLDAIGDEIEEPFGLEDNDLPLSTISRMIEVNLRQRLGERDLPPLLQPVNDVLQ